MRSFFLSLALTVASLWLVAATPSQAHAFGWRTRSAYPAYYSSYYPGSYSSYSYPGYYNSYYPGTYTYPAYSYPTTAYPAYYPSYYPSNYYGAYP